MTLLILSFLLFVSILVLERWTIQRRIRAVPIRITVTGTRGKSTVVRLLASVIREDGRRVLAKTTGSEARLILPDGSEEEVLRNGSPSVLEQKKFLSRAVRIGADCTVAEVMSIHPENHRIERRILQPQVVLITNSRADHTESMGKTPEEIASVFYEDIPHQARVFIPANEVKSFSDFRAQRPDQEWSAVDEGCAEKLKPATIPERRECFQEGIDLVFAVSKHLGISSTNIGQGIQKARLDIGAWRIWQVPLKGLERSLLCVNAFAANDPESTEQVLEKVKTVLDSSSNRVIGLLNLRRDRGDRTLQWLDKLTHGMGGLFHRLIVIGDGAHFLRKKLPRVEMIKKHKPEQVMEWLAAHTDRNDIVFGCGNMKGAGLRLVQLWDRTGKPYAV